MPTSSRRSSTAPVVAPAGLYGRRRPSERRGSGARPDLAVRGVMSHDSDGSAVRSHDDR